MSLDKSVNVLGTDLQSCSQDPLTGFFRDGYCRTCAEDVGMHSVCCLLDEAFLAFSKDKGNDLLTPRPEFGFPGLKPGQLWCLCADRWMEAYESGVAPKVRLQATHEKTLERVPLELLKEKALDMH